MPQQSERTGKLMQRSEKSIKYEMMEKLNDVKEMIDRHMEEVHSGVELNIRETLAFLKAMQRQDGVASPLNTQIQSANKLLQSPYLAGLLGIWKNLQPKVKVDVSVGSDESQSENLEVS